MAGSHVLVAARGLLLTGLLAALLATSGCVARDAYGIAQRYARYEVGQTYPFLLERIREQREALLSLSPEEQQELRINVILDPSNVSELRFSGTVYELGFAKGEIDASLMTEGSGNASTGPLNASSRLYACTHVAGRLADDSAEWTSVDVDCPEWLVEALHEVRPDAKPTTMTESLATTLEE